MTTNELLCINELYKYFRIPIVFEREIEWMADDQLREAVISYSEKVSQITKLLKEKDK